MSQHWADRTAEELIEQRPDVDVYTCASGISPSGSIHIGNMRDLATIYFVGRALAERGKRVRLIHSWDDYDRFRKVPKAQSASGVGLPKWLEDRATASRVPASFEEHIGRPLAYVPDPFGEYGSYAERHERQFEAALAGLGVEVELIHQVEMYESGVYVDGIVDAVRARREIFDIIAARRTQEASEEERERYLPLTVYFESCRRDTTRLTLVDETTPSVAYTCASCGHEATLDLTTARNVKLPWKVDWAMRWRHERVVFEPGGKDHATAGGSYEVSSEISEKVFGYAPPVFQPYEFIGIKGLTGKMSGSTGLLLTPSDLLEIYQPEVLLWIYARVAPMKAFDIAVDDQVLRMYDEFDRALAGEPQVETDVRALELARVSGREIHPVPFRQLTGFSGIVQGDPDALEALFARMGTPHPKADFEERLGRANAWLERYMPEQRITLLDAPNTAFSETLSDEERSWVAALAEWLAGAGEVSIDEATEKVYEIPKRPEMDEKTIGAAQRRFFKIVYNLLFARDRGPRLGTFLAAVPRERYLRLLLTSDV
jgi:lysyl-tRNA synthetase class 1